MDKNRTPFKIGDSVKVKQVENAHYYSWLGEEGKRIQKILADVDPDDEIEVIETWGAYLEHHLTFPFEAVVDEWQERGPLRAGEKVNVKKISLVDDFLYSHIMALSRSYVAWFTSTRKSPKGILLCQLFDGGFIYLSSTQFIQEGFADIREGLRRATLRFGRIVPPAIMAQQQMISQTGIQHILNTLDEKLVGTAFSSDGIIFDPCSTTGYLQMQIKVRFILSVDPDKTFWRVSRCFDDVELIQHYAASYGVAANNGICDRTGSGRSSQDFGLTLAEAIVART